MLIKHIYCEKQEDSDPPIQEKVNCKIHSQVHTKALMSKEGDLIFKNSLEKWRFNLNYMPVELINLRPIIHLHCKAR